MPYGPLWRAGARGGTQGPLKRLRRRKVVEGPTAWSALHKKDERAKNRKPYMRSAERPFAGLPRHRGARRGWVFGTISATGYAWACRPRKAMKVVARRLSN